MMNQQNPMQDPLQQQSPQEVTKVTPITPTRSKKPYIILAFVGIFVIGIIGVGAYLLLDDLRSEEEEGELVGEAQETDIDDEEAGDENTEVVDEDVLASVPVIAIDSEGNPHVISYETESLDLRYAVRRGGSWENETVDADGDIGDGHEIAVDDEGNPHICYRDKTNGSVKYATKINGSWVVEVLDDPAGEGDSVESSSIAIDSSGNPRIAYNVQSTSDLPYIKYAVWNGSSWTKSTTGINGHWVSLALDSDDNPHIAFHSDEEMRVYYAKKLSSGSWEDEIVDSETSVESDPRLSLDSSGNPHIMYRGEDDNGTIKYASWDGSSWNVETVATSVGSGDMQDFVIGNDDKPYIIYSISMKLTLATKGGDDWEFEEICRGGVNSVAVDDQSRVHVAFTFGADEGEIIKYVRVVQ